MKICNKCSVANDDRAVFCTGCGAVLPNNRDENTQAQTCTASENPVNSEPNTAPSQQTGANPYAQAQQPYAQANSAYAQSTPPYVQPVFTRPQMPYSPQFGFIDENMLPNEYKPVTVWQYIGLMLLLFVPVAGPIILIIMAFGAGDKSISLKNFARAILVLLGVFIVLSFVFTFLAGMFATQYGAAPY